MHTRNVAGHKLVKIAGFAYEQQIGKKKRWFVRSNFGWYFTEKFTDKPKREYLLRFPTLVAAVIAANKRGVK